MVKEVRIYIEGGGDGKNTKQLLRQGFSSFFKELVQMARSNQIKWNMIVCGSRNNAFRDFKNALADYPKAFIVLLVYSEAPVVKQSPWEHLKSRDNWDSPGVDDTHCYLMVQAMEAWLIADIDTLKRFYGQGFKENAIPKNRNVEMIEKDLLEPSLKAATRDTKSKGEYQKIQHASKLLEMLDVDNVRKASSECDRIFTTLTELMEQGN
ncbi:MAG: DUF4276 family protein [Microcoleus sp. PH2017_10_PVI_O_A]|uniref:DUF4276 family protein n=1 Tax=unclassified Microcoleus TaxID=2642155 RepID=UPI001DF87907|nr:MULTISPECIES: DUF4276 family protein [unclassified Microcoleus]TAE84745.1 MAG: DUF4276 family protein [Oscillatoriales cyanobacterium]MCC3405007.1 DUF4276 family protein [Microcoleus sp. PH2017_10_PVI_O_A]MCC3458972.1 DUF4276 family protein [Microcoleus sp. PH2017_11_PCY_U_A]MCC3477805.1 DUF4276 family protein [Microcoleus sp. PH2017_12_PCY_D_A]MCC3527748.1 DUF4276 family protein [Microcoleus sp. PH2017_21_RUC_O_A]